MVKLRKALPDEGGDSLRAGRDCLAISDYAAHKGYRDKRLTCVKVLRMLTPRRAGPVGPEEFRDGSEEKGASGARSGAITPGSYENDGSRAFLMSGRTGRRNALPDILGHRPEPDLADLPDRFAGLSTHPDQAESSGRAASIPDTSKQHG